MDEIIKKYLEENLSINIEVLTDYDYDTKTNTIEVEIKLKDEIIASDSTYIS